MTDRAGSRRAKKGNKFLSKEVVKQCMREVRRRSKQCTSVCPGGILSAGPMSIDGCDSNTCTVSR